MTLPLRIEGTCMPRFEGVREAFAANFAAGREVGASLIVNVFSTTKAMTALCAHVLVDRGALELAAPVSRYWSEFAQGGKERLPVHLLLSHRAGLAALRPPLPTEALYDWARMTEVLAAEAPWWEPGSASGYHAMTFGFLIGELVRRITGKTLGAFLRDEIAAPLRADFAIGLAESEDARVADMVPPSAEEVLALGAAGALDPESLLGKVMGNPAVSIEEQSHGRDLVLGVPLRWGLGFMLTSETLSLGPNPRCFGHGGWGGSLGIVDLDARLSWSYVMNKMSPGTLGDTRGASLAAALYAAL